MSRYARINMFDPITAMFNGAGTNYVIETPTGVLYMVYTDGLSDVSFVKSTDGGISWSAPTTIHTGTVTQLSVWYDRWSGINGGLIHCAYADSGDDDVDYRTIDTESGDALSTATVIFAGSSTAGGCHLSITRARGGNVYCKAVIDAGAEGGFFRLLNADVPNGAWASRTVDETIATTDMMILVPGFAADDQDIMGIFWDASANEISRKIYDDSGNSWAETSFSTNMAELVATTGFPNFDAVVDLANSRIIMVAWSAVDAANADLRCWLFTESAINEVTNVVLNSTDDQGLCALSLDTVTGRLYCFYAGKSAGGDTWNTALSINYKYSDDFGTTWSAEIELVPVEAGVILRQLLSIPRKATIKWPFVAYYRDAVSGPDTMSAIVQIAQARAQFQLGV